MARLSKRQKAIRGQVDRQKLYPLSDALALVKQCNRPVR
jgi:large subunit ribosomal protein L1